jgi:hypothetical protein
LRLHMPDTWESIRLGKPGWPLVRLVSAPLKSVAPGQSLLESASHLFPYRRRLSQLQWLRHKSEHVSPAEWPSPPPVHEEPQHDPKEAQKRTRERLTTRWLQIAMNETVAIWRISGQLDPLQPTSPGLEWLDWLTFTVGPEPSSGDRPGT